ncbi:MAG: WD40/YVTN/BNR-like repeat-containing protein, partial [Longimicrobiales bacterium]
ACNDSVTRPDAVTHRAGEAQLVALAEGDGRVVAVGTRYWYHTDDDGSAYAPDSDSAVVVWSADARTWQVAALPKPAGGLFGLAYGNGVFLASGSIRESGQSVAVVWHSTDGSEWQQSTPGVALRSIAFGNGYFVAADGNGVMRSTDGNNWERVFQRAALDTEVTFTGNRFVFHGSGGLIATSPDSHTWQVHVLTSSVRMVSVLHDGALFLGSGVTASEDIRHFSLRSADGILWSSLLASGSLPRISTFHEGRYIALSSAGIFLSTNASDWELTRPAQQTRAIPEFFYTATFALGHFIAIGRGQIATSVNGRTWTTIAAPRWPLEN